MARKGHESSNACRCLARQTAESSPEESSREPHPVRKPVQDVPGPATSNASAIASASTGSGGRLAALWPARQRGPRTAQDVVGARAGQERHRLAAGGRIARPETGVPSVRRGPLAGLAGCPRAVGADVPRLLPAGSSRRNAGLAALPGSGALYQFHRSTGGHWVGAGWGGTEPVEDWPHAHALAPAGARHPENGDDRSRSLTIAHDRARSRWLVRVQLVCRGAEVPRCRGAEVPRCREKRCRRAAGRAG